MPVHEGNDARSSEVLRGGRVKGSILRIHFLWVRRFRGEQAEEDLLESMPAPLRAQIESIVPSDWYPFETLVQLDRLIVDRFGGGDERFARELGRYSAHLNLSVPFRSFKRDDIREFFREAARLHHEFQDFGEVECVELAEKHVQMIHRNYPSFSPLFCNSGYGYYEQTIVEHRARPVRVEEVTCLCRGDEACTFDLTWV